MVKNDGVRRPRELLDQLNALGVILLLDPLVRVERLVHRRSAEVPEPGRIERNGVLLAAQVLNLDLVRCRAEVAFQGLDGDVRLRAVRRGSVVVERGRYGFEIGSGHG